MKCEYWSTDQNTLIQGSVHDGIVTIHYVGIFNDFFGKFFELEPGEYDEKKAEAVILDRYFFMKSHDTREYDDF